MLSKRIESESVDLVYLEPPFNSNQTFTMSGRVLVAYGVTDLINSNLITPSGLWKGSACTGTAPFADVNAGTQVIVTDERGTVMGASALQGGTFTTLSNGRL